MLTVQPAPRWQHLDDENETRVWVYPGRVADGLLIHCRVIAPRSSEGRSALLWIEPRQADTMLRILRDYARDRRAL